MKVKAIFSFDHDGARRRGDEFEVSDRVGNQLINKGLARLMECVATAPALPAVQANDMPSADENAAVALVAVSGVADGPVAQAQAGGAPGVGEDAAVALVAVSGVADGPIAQAQAGDTPSAGEDAAVATELFQDDAAPGTGSGRKAKRASAPVEGAEPK
ncbi:hypothetical protein [Alcaligenes sp. SDU_A2]|uniref:hypothetical protein n=1 Tax=Alcaligenes sp. SDU_A2 TaxID=3136634 RepID=UPI00311ECB51